jgi:hypothetical protein
MQAERDSWLERLRGCCVMATDGSGSGQGGDSGMIDGVLQFEAFKHLLASDELIAHLPTDWRARCRKITKLRRAFLNADLAGDHTITRAELEVVVLASDAGAVFSVEEMDHAWRLLDPAATGEVRSWGHACTLHCSRPLHAYRGGGDSIAFCAHAMHGRWTGLASCAGWALSRPTLASRGC